MTTTLPKISMQVAVLTISSFYIDRYDIIGGSTDSIHIPIKCHLSNTNDTVYGEICHK